VDLVVVNPDGSSATLPGGYAYEVAPTAPPVLLGIAPAEGPAAGGTTVTASGTDFAPGAQVTFGGVAGTAVQVLSPTSLEATTPPHAPGPVNVSVVNPDGQKWTLMGAFSYTAPPRQKPPGRRPGGR
jgi:hypothetical protein